LRSARRARQADVEREVNYHVTALRPIEDDEACCGRCRHAVDSFNLHKRARSARTSLLFAQYEDVTIEKSGDHIAAARDLQDQREQGVTACDRPDVTMTMSTAA